MTGKRIFHVSADIDDFLGRPRIGGLLSHDDGRLMTDAEVRRDLAAWKVDGFALRPLSPCDNFHPKKGCQGHPVTEQEDNQR